MDELTFIATKNLTSPQIFAQQFRTQFGYEPGPFEAQAAKALECIHNALHDAIDYNDTALMLNSLAQLYSTTPFGLVTYG